jgi:hypothetical protein
MKREKPRRRNRGFVFVAGGNRQTRYKMRPSNNRSQRRRQRHPKAWSRDADATTLGLLMKEDEDRGIGSTADARYFKEQPHRHHRVRLATSAEISAMDLVNGPPPLSAGDFRWVVIRQLAPGVRVRLHFVGPLPPGPIADIGEDAARETFECAASSNMMR